MAVMITLNGQIRDFELAPQSSLLDLVAILGFKADQVALEQNGHIIRRAMWAETVLVAGDRLEIVQFVGGGCPVSSLSKDSQRSP